MNLQHFDDLTICHVSMDSFDQNGIGWYKQEMQGSCLKGTSGSGLSRIHSNPQFSIELKDTDADSNDTCSCLISLLQFDGRRKRADGLDFSEAFASICKYSNPSLCSSVPSREKVEHNEFEHCEIEYTY